VDSLRLLETINREAEKVQRRIKVLIEVHVAKEVTKSGFTPEEFLSLNTQLSTFNHIEICGIMGMATNTDEEEEIRRCFRMIKHLADNSWNTYQSNSNKIVSMGMSDDYQIAIEEGSNMVRIGSSIFGDRY
jgi:pyridoxal phosphate enzyme (YggS family)